MKEKITQKLQTDCSKYCVTKSNIDHLHPASQKLRKTEKYPADAER